MAHILQNDQVQLHVDLPEDNYQSSRFDWTGKIVRVYYKGLPISGFEFSDQNPKGGLGFYNEFGIDQPIGFDEIQPGQWFHKIGVGLLQKEDDHYDFQKAYAIRPASFEITATESQVNLICRANPYGGYAYLLEKEIVLQEDGFTIQYELSNTGEKAIYTNEYVHNFMAIHDAPIDVSTQLNFPFAIKQNLFGETVNPEGFVEITKHDIRFSGKPSVPFFFSNLSGGKLVKAKWTLKSDSKKIGISEIGDFETAAVNLWGTGHVISPELFVQIDLDPGKTTSWTRTYRIFEF